MRVLITGADGFVAKNLMHRLASMSDVQVATYTRQNTLQDLYRLAPWADCVFHLAGVNRPPSPEQFMQGNLGLTQTLCEALRQGEQREGRMVVYTSSTQAALDNPYGQSKRAAEDALRDLSKATGIQVWLYRLPNVFGRWSRPNYNSAVATFCHNIAHDIPIQIHNASALLTLVHVDDVVDSFIQAMHGDSMSCDKQGFVQVAPVHETTVGQVAAWIKAIHHGQVPESNIPGQSRLIVNLKDTYFSSLQS